MKIYKTSKFEKLCEQYVLKLLYHGTSLKQFEKIKSNDYNVNNLYVGDNQENITNHYAEKQSNIDNSPQVTIVLDQRKMGNLQQDFHSVIGDEEEQIGQFYFSGNIRDAIVRIEMYDEDSDKVILLDT